MREIKFRAWDIPDRKMSAWEEIRDNMNMGNFENNEIIFMQYTGLKDKNGKEIYEGDIVKQKWDGHIGEVWFNENSARFYIDESKEPDAISYHLEVEVIGNIYENPELLKGGENS